MIFSTWVSYTVHNPLIAFWAFSDVKFWFSDELRISPVMDHSIFRCQFSLFLYVFIQLLLIFIRGKFLFGKFPRSCRCSYCDVFHELRITPCSAAACYMHLLRENWSEATAQKVHIVRRQLQHIVSILGAAESNITASYGLNYILSTG